MNLLRLEFRIDQSSVSYRGDVMLGESVVGEFNATRIVDHGQAVIELRRIFVEEETRSIGVATTIINSVAEWAQNMGYPTIVGELQPDNPSDLIPMTIAMEHLGFTVTGTDFKMNLIPTQAIE